MRELSLAIALLVPMLCFGNGAARAQEPVRGCIAVEGVSGQLSCAEGWTPKLLAALTNTAVSIKSPAGLNVATPPTTAPSAILGTLYCYNPNSSVAYIQIYDVASAAGVTVGTTVPTLSFGIPATSANGLPPAMIGIPFFNGIQAAATTTAKGGSAPSTAMDCNATYN